MEIRGDATINPPLSMPRLLSSGHFRTEPSYCTVREDGRRDWLLFYTLSGSGRIVHMDGPLLTQAGQCVIYPPGVPHDYRTAPGLREWEFQWAHFLPWTHWLGLLSWPQVYRGIKFLHVRDRSVHARVGDALDRMCQHRSGPQRQRELFAMNALEEALLWLNSVNPGLEQTRFDQRIRSAMDYMCRHFTRKVTLGEVARECGLSPSRFSHLFREQVGLTPVQYLEQQRIRRSQELLEDSALSIARISDMVGYESPFYFSRRFSAVVGTSPRMYRTRAETSG
jgi:AraC family transcriptional regulator of arabinose operon